jgi:primosomal protein N' (replication factor Y)
MRYPPVVALVNAVVRAKTFSRAMDDAAEIGQRLDHLESGRFRVLGPAPAPLGRLRGEYRAQLLVKGSSRRSIREALTAVLGARPELARRATIDVDPVSML